MSDDDDLTTSLLPVAADAVASATTAAHVISSMP